MHLRPCRMLESLASGSAIERMAMTSLDRSSAGARSRATKAKNDRRGRVPKGSGRRHRARERRGHRDGIPRRRHRQRGQSPATPTSVLSGLTRSGTFFLARFLDKVQASPASPNRTATWPSASPSPTRTQASEGPRHWSSNSFSDSASGGDPHGYRRPETQQFGTSSCSTKSGHPGRARNVAPVNIRSEETK